MALPPRGATYVDHWKFDPTGMFEKHAKVGLEAGMLAAPWGRVGKLVGELGVAGRAEALLTQAGRFFYDARSYDRIRREYWAGVGANGASLHHWLFPRSAHWVPQGIRNAGFNLIELPAMRGTFHPTLSLNTWMGFAKNWGAGPAFQARLVENSLRIAIPAAAGGTAWGSYQIGDQLHETLFGMEGIR